MQHHLKTRAEEAPHRDKVARGSGEQIAGAEEAIVTLVQHEEARKEILAHLVGDSSGHLTSEHSQQIPEERKRGGKEEEPQGICEEDRQAYSATQLIHCPSQQERTVCTGRSSHHGVSNTADQPPVASLEIGPQVLYARTLHRPPRL